MQLIISNRTAAFIASALLVGSLLLGACHKTQTRPGAIRVSFCELSEHPAAYDGKLIQLDATLTGLAEGNYVYPGPTSDKCSGGEYSFIKLDADHIQSNVLADLGPPTVSSPERKEFDLELTGTFDSKYSEPWDHFRYRIVAVEIKRQSPVRIGKRLGAA